jgi:hypothetical protein
MHLVKSRVRWVVVALVGEMGNSHGKIGWKSWKEKQLGT